MSETQGAPDDKPGGDDVLKSIRAIMRTGKGGKGPSVAAPSPTPAAAVQDEKPDSEVPSGQTDEGAAEPDDTEKADDVPATEPAAASDATAPEATAPEDEEPLDLSAMMMAAVEVASPTAPDEGGVSVEPSVEMPMDIEAAPETQTPSVTAEDPAPEPAAPAVDDVPAPPALPPVAHPPSEGGALMIDEGALEDMVRRVLRAELIEGEIGRNISDNVQAMIEEEVARILEEREADKGE